VTTRARKREVGRGERVLPGVWRLRLPLPWPGVPHCNAWAVAAGDGVVLFDCGMHEPGSWADLERALAMVGLRVEHVRLLVCTHAHADHYGQAAPIVQTTGCELWMHPNHRHLTAALEDPEAGLERRLEIARSAGVPDEPLRRWAQERRERSSGVAAVVEPDRPLVDGVEIDADLGVFRAVETPGHAPSHVCLWQPERRLLISGDHLLGRVSIYFDFGHTPDPVGEFLASLDRVETLGARLCLSGHGRTFTDVQGHIAANRTEVADGLAAIEEALRGGAPATAYEVVRRVHGESASPAQASWWMQVTLAYLRHLEVSGRAERDAAGGPDRWRAAS
jgi:glyoxylase-like metal-dependent hydrolase (beta-lactamase superfamily II)